MNLLADGAPDGGRLGVLLALATLGGGAIQYLITVARDWWRERRATDEKQVEQIVKHLEALVARLDKEKADLVKDIEEVQEEVRKLMALLTKCRIHGTQRKSHIRYLESVLARNSLSFEKYTEDDSEDATEPHKPLPTPAPKPEPGGAT